MLDYLWLLVVYYIYLCVENIHNGFIPHELFQYVHNRYIELEEYKLDVIHDKYYYFQDEHGNIELRAPIFIPINE